MTDRNIGMEILEGIQEIKKYKAAEQHPEVFADIQQSDVGWGDYTKERELWLEKPSLSEIAIGIKNMKRLSKSSA
jgi:hypothetical protein